MKKNKTETGLSIIFLIMGLIFVIAGSSIIIASHVITGSRVYTKARITRIEKDYDEYKVYVEYKVDGKTYEKQVEPYFFTYHTDKEILIYYHKNAPSLIGSPFAHLEHVSMILIGIVFVLIFAIPRLKKKKRYALKTTGTLVYATYISTLLNGNYAVNGKHPYNIYCKWPSPTDGLTYTFKSENLWENPEPIIQANNITQIPVYVNMNNLKKYLVDTSEIEEKIAKI